MKTLVKTATRETARGDVKEGFKRFEQRGLPMPDPLLLYTASPGYFSIMLQRNTYFSTHPTLSAELLAHIRYFVSSRLEFGFCRLFNKSLLEKMGMTAADFKAMGNDPEKCLLEDREKKMLVFVLGAMADPEGVEDLENLHGEGWTDADILDALVQGVGMMDHALLMRIFTPA